MKYCLFPLFRVLLMLLSLSLGYVPLLCMEGLLRIVCLTNTPGQCFYTEGKITGLRSHRDSRTDLSVAGKKLKSKKYIKRKQVIG